MAHKVNCYIEIPPLDFKKTCEEYSARASGVHDQVSENSEDAGCYIFQTDQAAVSSIFVHWRAFGSALYLAQESLQGVLVHNSVKINFSNQILPGGVKFFEAHNNLVCLIATSAAVYRIALQKNSEENTSILKGLTSVQLNDSSNCHVYRTQANVHPPKHADSYLSPTEDAYFAIAQEATVQLIKLGKLGQVTVANELRHATFMGRIWGGLVPGVLRSSKPAVSSMDAVQIVSINNETFVFGLSRDAKVHAWNATSLEHKGSYELDRAVGKDFSLSTEKHQMHAWIDHNDQTHLIIYLSSSNWQEFLVYETYYISGVLSLTFRSHIHSMKRKLRNFSCGQSNLFALWEDSEGYTLSHSSLVSQDNVWITDEIWKLHFEPLNVEDLGAMEVYLNDIFRPYHFSEESVGLALEEFCETYGLELTEGTQRGLVIDAVELRVSQLLENNIEEDCTETAWKEFRELCVKYQTSAVQPIAIAADPSSGINLLLRKAATGVVRLKDELETLFSLEAPAQIGTLELADVQAVLEIKLLLNEIRQFLDDRQDSFFQELLEGRTEPSAIAADVAKRLFEEHGTISTMTARFTSSVSAVTLGFRLIGQLLLPGLEPVACSPHHTLVKSFPHCLAERCLSQMVEFRYTLCRDLLILIELLNMRRKFAGLQSRDESAVGAPIKIAFSQHTISFWLMRWICSTPVAPVQPIIKQNHAQKLPLVRDVAELFSFQGVEACKSLADIYVRSYGLKMATVDVRKAHSLDDTIDMLLRTIGHSLIAQMVLHDTRLPVAFTSAYQYVAVQTYLHYTEKLESTGMKTDAAYRALCCYLSGEPEKACDIFISGIQNEVLGEQMDMEEEETAKNTQRLDYIIRLISLFDGDNLHGCVAKLAGLALSSCEPHSSLASTLWCKLFWARLAMGENAQAYSALESNPDSSQTSDLLRSFLFTLLERGHARDLLNYSYSGMEDYIHDYLLSRARSMQVDEARDFYNFLYSLNITKSNPRRASIVMYEQAYRLKTESEPTITVLQQRVQCFLASISCLEIVNPSNAWVEEPDLRSDLMDDEMRGEGHQIDRTISVQELPDIRKEYDLTLAQLTLLQNLERQGLFALAPSTAEETVVQLMKVRNYELALTVANRFDLKTAPVIEALTSDYVNLLMSLRNDFSAESETLQLIRSNNPSVREDAYGRPLEQVQRLLETSLASAEKPLSSACHRACASRMLSADISLPAWLVKSYTARNAPELISLYHQLGFLEDASYLAVERFSDMTRKLEEVAFKRREEIMPASRLTVLDRLVMELKHQAKMDPYWNKIHDEVVAVRSGYLTAVRSADDAIYG